MPPRSRNITSPPAITSAMIDWTGYFDIYYGRSHAVIFPNNPIAIPEHGVAMAAFRSLMHSLDRTRPVSDERFYSFLRILAPVPDPLICDIVFIGNLEEVMNGIRERNDNLMKNIAENIVQEREFGSF